VGIRWTEGKRGLGGVGYGPLVGMGKCVYWRCIEGADIGIAAMA
jgi:hypothetical protein